MAEAVLHGTVLNPGACQAPLAVLDEPLSFWGGFDPVRGMVVDQHHPQAGLRLGGRILVMPASRGSAGTPAGIAESIRRRTGPAAVVLAGADVNIAIGAMVADRLYGTVTPVVALAPADYACLASGTAAAVAGDGTVTVTSAGDPAGV